MDRIKLLFIEWNDDQMTEWGQNEEYFKIQFFLPPLKSSSFLLISSFSIISEWPGMKITMEIYHSQGIPFIFTLFLSLSSFQDAVGMMEWGWNEGNFWREAKPLIQKSPSFHYHSIIPWNTPIDDIIIPFIWASFLIWILQITPWTLYSFRRKSLPWLRDSRMGRMTSEWKEQVLSLL